MILFQPSFHSGPRNTSDGISGHNQPLQLGRIDQAHNGHQTQGRQTSAALKQLLVRNTTLKLHNDAVHFRADVIRRRRPQQIAAAALTNARNYAGINSEHGVS